MDFLCANIYTKKIENILQMIGKNREETQVQLRASHAFNYTTLIVLSNYYPVHTYAF